MSDPLEQVRTYHQCTKHHFHAYARSLGYLDWATQPDPFRRYRGAPVIELDKIPPGDTPLYEAAFVAGHVPPAPLNRRSISQLFFDSLSISAWKQDGDISWALRVNPSSGNLHPTEGYLVCGPEEGLCDAPMVCHYAPRDHVLEQRVQFPLETWQTLSADLPRDAVLVGLASIHWREAWKYGERAFRYCQHDVGHAIATLSLAAAGLGWQATLLDDVGAEALAGLLGLFDFRGAEVEHPDCVLAVYPQGQACPTRTLPADALQSFSGLAWQGRPNQLSPGHVPWSIINDVADATAKPPTQLYTHSGHEPAAGGEPLTRSTPLSLRRVIHQRRSAVAMDGVTGIPREVFYNILRKTLPRPERFPLNAWPWRPHVHLALFVHRVHDLPPGLYLLVRDPAQKASLQAALRDDFAWERPTGWPADLGLYRLARDDVRLVSRQLSCHQEIASDGCFSLGMLAEFEAPLEHFGPWFYPRLFWECGMLGQVLYLEAEAAGVRGTGIGCFFDDPVHELLGLKDTQYQSLYHFTLGGPVEDPRLTTLPAYPASQSNSLPDTF
jgi:SagB-type dehydrogenase family enzyme